MTKPLSHLWRALDEIPLACTTRYEWLRRLNDDPPASLAFLRSNGTLATEIDCPSPGGAGCPRRVVKLSGGRLRAVCGNAHAECEAIDLGMEDATCLALDRKKFALELCKLLRISPGMNTDALVIGTHPVTAGLGIPVALFIPGPDGYESPPEMDGVAPPAVLLTPTPTSISPGVSRDLKLKQYSIWALSEFIRVDDQHQLVTLDDPEVLFGPIRTALIAEHSPRPAQCIWPLPPGTSWEMLTFDFIDLERLNVRFRDRTRVFEPDELDLKDRRTGKARDGWGLLLAFAARGGRLPRASPSNRGKFQKQKQLLCECLIRAFGISEVPIVWRKAEQHYVTRFVMRDSRPKGITDRGHR